MESCPCGSGSIYPECCEPFVSGMHKPSTAEALMRARYTAYTRKKIEYIHQTHHPQTRDQHDMEEARKWAENSEWLGLEVVSTEAGGPGDSEGTVEFIARYQVDDEEVEHHELSQFKRVDDEWFFHDGKMIGQEPIRREEPKVGRNDPCPCGSGKKFKKCCG